MNKPAPETEEEKSARLREQERLMEELLGAKLRAKAAASKRGDSTPAEEVAPKAPSNASEESALSAEEALRLRLIRKRKLLPVTEGAGQVARPPPPLAATVAEHSARAGAKATVEPAAVVADAPRDAAAAKARAPAPPQRTAAAKAMLVWSSEALAEEVVVEAANGYADDLSDELLRRYDVSTNPS